MSNLTTVITFGTFDVFHIGHVNILRRAKELGDRLVVGVSSDKMNFDKKGRFPIYPQSERIEIISSLRCVDTVFLEESMAEKENYIQRYSANILVMGDDWKGKFDDLNRICQVHYLPRTQGISTTKTISKIKVYS